LTVDISASRNYLQKKRIKRFWKDNHQFLLDVSVKRSSLFNHVRHIIGTYARHNSRGFLPYSSDKILENILRSCMSEILFKDLMEFDGTLKLLPVSVQEEPIQSQFYREKLLAFNLVDTDEFNDLLNICVPHVNISENLVNKKVNQYVLEMSSGLMSNETLITNISGLRILNYDRISRQLTKALELSPRSISEIEFSKVLVEIKNLFLTKYYELESEIRNAFPLMIQNSES